MKLENISIMAQPKYSTGTKKDGTLWHRLALICKEEKYPRSESFYMVVWGDLAIKHKNMREGAVISTEGPPLEVTRKGEKHYINTQIDILTVIKDGPESSAIQDADEIDLE